MVGVVLMFCFPNTNCFFLSCFVFTAHSHLVPLLLPIQTRRLIALSDTHCPPDFMKSYRVSLVFMTKMWSARVPEEPVHFSPGHTRQSAPSRPDLECRVWERCSLNRGARPVLENNAGFIGSASVCNVLLEKAVSTSASQDEIFPVVKQTHYWQTRILTAFSGFWEEENSDR